MRFYVGFLIILLITAPAYGQAANPAEKSLRVGIGAALASGQSKIDRTSPIYKTVIGVLDADMMNKHVFAQVSAKWSPEAFGGKSIDALIYNNAFSLGPVHIGPGANYFYALDKDVVWDDGMLNVSGITRKQYASIGIQGNIGNFKRQHILFYAGAGATEMRKKISLTSDGRPLEGSPALVDLDVVGIITLGTQMEVSLPWRISANAEIRRTSTPSIFTTSSSVSSLSINSKLLVPEKQTTIKGIIRISVLSWLGAGIFGNWSSDDTGMTFLGNSYGIKTIFSF